MKIAIFNGFPFHYEMFGYIIYYCNLSGHELTIYTTNDTHGWKEFYIALFPNVNYKEVKLFSSEYMLYDYIFLTTDDDRSLSEQYISCKNIICIDHNFSNRRPSIDIFFHIATRPFSINYRKWALPCYPIVSSISEKIKILTQNNNYINIVILGGSNDYQINQINRIYSDTKIALHIISRNINVELLSSLDKRFTLYIHQNISTNTMIQILKQSKYMLCDITNNNDHKNGLSMSGSVPLAFSNLNTLILSNNNNVSYKFKSVQVFDINTNDRIYVNNIINEEDITKIYEERSMLIESFHSHMKTIIDRS